MVDRSVVLATAGYDHTIRFWQAPTGVCHRSAVFADSQVNCLETSNDKTYVAAGGNPHVRLYDCLNTNNSNPINNYTGHTNNVTSIGFQRDNRWLFSASEDGTVKIWDVRAPGCQREFQAKAPITSAVLHPNQGEIYLTDENGALRVWDLTANHCSMEIVPEGKVPLRSVSIASDASICVAAGTYGSVFVWDCSRKSFEPLVKIDAHRTYVLRALISPNAKLLATTSADKSLKIWNIARGFSLDRTLLGHQGWVWDCAFSADSVYVVSASTDKTAKLWDISSGEVILEYRGHSKVVTSVTLNDS